MKKLIRENILDIEPYPPGKPIKEVERELGIKEAIKMASNENPLGPSPKAVEAMLALINHVNVYPDGNAYYLKNALAARLNVKAENIVLGNGSDEVIRMITETFLNDGEEAIMGEPAFLIYRLAVKIMNGKSRLVNLKNSTHDLTAMADMINEKTKLIFIANPNNPTGTMVTAQGVDSFMKRVPEDVIVVFDEAYYEYIERDDFPQTLDYMREGKPVIILRTFSKIYGLAGLRIGYGIAGEEFVSAMNRVRQPFNTNSLSQAAAMGALDDDEHVKKSREVNREGKKFLYAELDKLKVDYVTSDANFILVNVQGGGKIISRELMKQEIIVRPMGLYNLPNSLRVTVGTEEQNKKFIEAFKIAIQIET